MTWWWNIRWPINPYIRRCDLIRIRWRRHEHQRRMFTGAEDRWSQKSLSKKPVSLELYTFSVYQRAPFAAYRNKILSAITYFAMLDKLAPGLHTIISSIRQMFCNPCERIAQDEGVGKRELYLLRVAALYHDTGFLYILYGARGKRVVNYFGRYPDVFIFSDEEKNWSPVSSWPPGFLKSHRLPEDHLRCRPGLPGRDDFYSISGS